MSAGELSDLVRDALRYYDELRHEPQRWVLVDLAPRILPEVTPRRRDIAELSMLERPPALTRETCLG